jgi:multicomponent Na+:H+ antiporter subunit E
MKGLLWVLLLAGAWAALNGTIASTQLAAGMALGLGVLIFLGGGGTDYLRKARKLAAFAVYFAYELVRANLRVARDVLSPRPPIAPGVVGVPLDLEGDGAIAFLSMVMTLTPGTLVLDVSEDRKTLYVHGMWAEDAEAFRREQKDGFERRIRELLE